LLQSFEDGFQSYFFDTMCQIMLLSLAIIHSSGTSHTINDLTDAILLIIYIKILLTYFLLSSSTCGIKLDFQVRVQS
jgi:hypothetical protein